MSVDIVNVTPDAINDKQIRLGSGAYYQAPLDFGTNWTKLRILMHFALGDTGGNYTVAGAPEAWFQVGLINNPSGANNILSATPSHAFVMCGAIGQVFTYNAGPPVYYSGKYRPVTRIGATIVYGGLVTGSVIVSADPNYRNIFVWDIQKTAPTTWSWHAEWPRFAADAQYDYAPVTDVEYYAKYGVHSYATATPYFFPYFGKTGGPSTSSNTVDESTNGDLNGICVSWPYAGTLAISGIYAVRIQ